MQTARPNLVADVVRDVERWRERDPATALRAVTDLSARLLAAPMAHDIGAVPPSTGAARWDALVAGVVARAARLGGREVPRWTGERRLVRWWVVADDVLDGAPLGFAVRALQTAPPDLHQRGVLLAEDDLDRV